MPGYVLRFSREPFLGNDGKPLANGKIETYAAGTNDPLSTYADADLTISNGPVVTLDSTGRAPIFVAAGVAYKVVVKTAAGALVYTEDDLTEPAITAPAAVAGLPTGLIADWPTAVAPSGWVLCDGTAYARADPLYAALFAVIGTQYGAGNGTTTFNVPDCRGRFRLGKAAAGTGSVLGQTGGTIDHTHTGPSHTHNIPPHTHTVPGHQHSVPRDGWGTVQAAPPVNGRLQSGGSGAGSEASVGQATTDNLTAASSAQVTSSTSIVADASGTGNTGTANPPFVVTNVIIKL